MDNINYKRRVKIFDSDDFEYITEHKLICDFYSCQICHRGNAIKYKPKNKERKPFNPKTKKKNIVQNQIGDIIYILFLFYFFYHLNILLLILILLQD